MYNINSCERPDAMPRKATVPSITCIEDELFTTGSISSTGKLSFEADLTGNSKRFTTHDLKNLRRVDEDDEGPKQRQYLLERLVSKSSGKSETIERDDLVKFELVEDYQLITIPITTCFMVLLSYIVWGAIIFSTWEVTITQRK